MQLLCIYNFCVDARSCSHREAIGVDAFKQHVLALHADGDYLLSQEYEVKLFHRLQKWSHLFFNLST